MSGFEAVIPYAVGALVGTTAMNMMADKPATPSTAAPSVKPPVPMPDPKGNDAAKKRSIAEMMARRGRASTILTDPAQSDALGG